MSDTAAMTVLHPSHIPRLLEEGLDDLVFVHVYVFPLFVPFCTPRISRSRRILCV